jgi:hypothetical protein
LYLLLFFLSVATAFLATVSSASPASQASPLEDNHLQLMASAGKIEVVANL